MIFSALVVQVQLLQGGGVVSQPDYAQHVHVMRRTAQFQRSLPTIVPEFIVRVAKDEPPQSLGMPMERRCMTRGPAILVPLVQVVTELRQDRDAFGMSPLS